MRIKVIGAGLAGCEAAWLLANAGFSVTLCEMKPQKYSPAHKTPLFAELVCSNSLKAARFNSAAGLLKWEMEYLGSLCVAAAKKCAVPAGGALAVQRDEFSKIITEEILNNKNITVEYGEVTKIDPDEYTIVATGPLTQGGLADSIKELCGDDYLNFYDAAAPIVTAESIDMNSAFFASRYDKGEGDDYINCPLNKQEYEDFYSELIKAERALLHDSDDVAKVYEGCMPIEILAGRGTDAIRFGPMKPVGLRDPRTGHRPWAVLQLRKENKEGTMFNLVGFQTNLKFPEQKRVFGMIPALKNAEYVRFGVMHRNSFINSPKVLNKDFSLKKYPKVYIAGQLSGVEGYMESAASGIAAALHLKNSVSGNKPVDFPNFTMMGALAGYISDEYIKKFEPMGANFGILPPLESHIRDKQERYLKLAERSAEWFKENMGRN